MAARIEDAKRRVRQRKADAVALAKQAEIDERVKKQEAKAAAKRATDKTAREAAKAAKAEREASRAARRARDGGPSPRLAPRGRREATKPPSLEDLYGM